MLEHLALAVERPFSTEQQFSRQLMASRLYSERFVAQTLNAANGMVASYTVPTGKRAIVTWFQTVSGTVGQVVRLQFTPLPGSTTYTAVRSVQATVDVPVIWLGRLVVYAGETFTITNATVGSTATVFASGYLLTGP